MAIDLTAQRWTIRYTHECTCEPRCYWAKGGRHTNFTYLNNGEQDLPAEQAAAKIAASYRHTGLADIEVRQETPEERDRRLAASRRAEAEERRGIHWAMGGAN